MEEHHVILEDLVVPQVGAPLWNEACRAAETGGLGMFRQDRCVEVPLDEQMRYQQAEVSRPRE